MASFMMKYATSAIMEVRQMSRKIIESAKKFYALKEQYPLETMAQHVEPKHADDLLRALRIGTLKPYTDFVPVA